MTTQTPAGWSAARHGRYALPLAWLVATMLGYVFAGVGGHFPGSFPVGSGVVVGFDTGAAAFGLLIGGVFGLVIGTLQWLVLRAWLGIPWPSLVATALAIAVTHALGDGLSPRWEYPPIAVAGAAVMASGLWLVLRDRADRVMLSIVNGSVFALAVIVGVLVGDPHSADWQRAHLVAGAVAGAVVGLGVGCAILWKSRILR